MRFLLLFTCFLLCFAALPGALPADASRADTHSDIIIDLGAHDVMCSDGNGPCQWVFAPATSARPPDQISGAYASAPSRLRILGRALAPQPPPPRRLS